MSGKSSVVRLGLQGLALAFGACLALAGCGGSPHPAAQSGATQTVQAGVQASGPSGASAAEPASSSATSSGQGAPEETVREFIRATLAGDHSRACGYVDPDAQSTCDSEPNAKTAGTWTVDGAVVSGKEALVELTGKVCSPGGGCVSNSKVSSGMPNGSVSFAYAYLVSQNGDSLSPVPCVEEDGTWYVNRAAS